MSTNVLVIGSGGREHALVWKLAQSPRIGRLYASPGNGGTQSFAENVPIDATDISKLLQFTKENGIDLTIVGPDDSLALGIVDVFRAQGLSIFGPTRVAAEIESSKIFAKNLTSEAGIPTAPFQNFSEYDRALAYVRERGIPIVIKANGLALGKGVYVCKTFAQAEGALTQIMLERVYGNAGEEVIIEEFLDGQEISIHALCDGESFVLFPPAQDHKSICDGDKGENTGGMGTIVPVPWVSVDTLRVFGERIVRPTLEALANRKRSFTGLLYPGLKMTSDGPKVLEFNARFGDPEAQSFMRFLKTDLLDLLEACVDGTLAKLTLEWYSGFAVCVTIVSGGYPGKYRKGMPIYGMAEAEQVPGVVVFHAGTSFDGGILKTSGGRVLGVSARGETLQSALDRAYEAVRCIEFEGMYYRRDIGAKALGLVF